MRRSSGARLLAALAALLALDAAWIALDRGTPPEPEFAGATRGLGLGAAIGAEWSFFAFDPRLESECENELEPLPGLACPDPVHGAGVARVGPIGLARPSRKP